MIFRFARITRVAFLFALMAARTSIAQTIDEAISPTNRIELFNGRNLDGWKFISQGTNDNPAAIWSVREGIIHCAGRPNGYARTIQSYRDYRLHLEWRWTEGGGNSGAFVQLNGPDKVWPLCLEVQLASGNAGEVRANGGSRVRELTDDHPRSVPRRAEASEKPPGEWNACDITCRGDTATVRVNGVLQNEVSGSSVTAGAIGLQAEGKPVEFRNIAIEPLKE